MVAIGRGLFLSAFMVMGSHAVPSLAREVSRGGKINLGFWGILGFLPGFILAYSVLELIASR